MARIAGVDLPRNKRLEIALTYIFGVGHSTAEKILEASGVDGDIRVKDLNPDDVNKLRKEVENHTVEGSLRLEVQRSIKRLIDVGCYRGLRHKSGLPVRGQRTRSNARTRKGPKGNLLKRAKRGKRERT
jgi:small subunit ribosomal protein S13